MDLLSEVHFEITPYNYVLNNPIGFIDPIGLDTTSVNTPKPIKPGENIKLDNGQITPQTIIGDVIITPDGSANNSNDNSNTSNNSDDNSNTPVIINIRVYNLNATIRHLDNYAQTKSCHQCALYVRNALQAGGINTSNHPRQARQYAPYLIRWGFRVVNPENYVPQRGDIRVFQPYSGGNPAGHIDMFNGDQWISDFREQQNLPGPGYRRDPNYEIFRMPDQP